ncbi:MAG: glycosyltransferase family 1 protein [Verrucomicrobiota bacterium]
MKIGVHCFPLHAGIGGMRQYFLSLFDALLECDTENEYVFFHQAKNVPELEALASPRWRENAVQLGKTARVARHLKGLDLYFSPLIVLKPRPLPLPTVVMIPDNQEVFFPDFFSERQKFTRAWHHRGSARMADRVLTVSEFSKTTLSRHYGIPPQKIRVAPHCVDARFYRAREAGRRPQAALPAGEFLFYPANRWPHKNHDRLLRALQFLAVEKGLKLDLVLTGHDVTEGYPAQRMAAEYGLGGHVFCAGYVSVEELAWLYHHAAMTVFPSLFEGFGLPLVEAMAAGCPVACSRAAALPETGGDAVDYFNPHSPREMAEAIQRLWTRRERRAALVERGHARAACFSPTRLVRAHLQAFQEARAAYRPWRYVWNALAGGPWHAWSAGRSYPEGKKADLSK